MPDWTSTAEIVRDSCTSINVVVHVAIRLTASIAIYAKFVLVLAGVAAWDVGSTLMFDLSIITGKRKWRWPMVSSFASTERGNV